MRASAAAIARISGRQESRFDAMPADSAPMSSPVHRRNESTSWQTTCSLGDRSELCAARRASDCACCCVSSPGCPMCSWLARPFPFLRGLRGVHRPRLRHLQANSLAGYAPARTDVTLPVIATAFHLLLIASAKQQRLVPARTGRRGSRPNLIPEGFPWNRSRFRLEQRLRRQDGAARRACSAGLASPRGARCLTCCRRRPDPLGRPIRICGAFRAAAMYLTAPMRTMRTLGQSRTSLGPIRSSPRPPRRRCGRRCRLQPPRPLSTERRALRGSSRSTKLSGSDVRGQQDPCRPARCRKWSKPGPCARPASQFLPSCGNRGRQLHRIASACSRWRES